MVQEPIYVYIDTNNEIQGLTTNKHDAKILKHDGVNIIKLNTNISSKIENIPMDKEIVDSYGVIMSVKEEENLIDQLNNQMEIFKNSIDNFSQLIQFIKDGDTFKILNNLSCYLHNIEDIFTDDADDICINTIDMKKYFTHLLKDVRK